MSKAHNKKGFKRLKEKIKAQKQRVNGKEQVPDFGLPGAHFTRRIFDDQATPLSEVEKRAAGIDSSVVGAHSFEEVFPEENPKVESVTECPVCGERHYYASISASAIKRGSYCGKCQTRRTFNIVPKEKWGNDPMLEDRNAKSL